MIGDLFEQQPSFHRTSQVQLHNGLVLLPGFAIPQTDTLLAVIADILKISPLRHFTTPGGFTMSVAMSNCGDYGWIADKSGYRYSKLDPKTDQAWPQMPTVISDMAAQAAKLSGYSSFIPDACLINEYIPGTKLSLHQDKNEIDFTAPIVSLSLGLSARFKFGGKQRSDKTHTYLLEHGDILVWGGESRLNYHGIMPLKDGYHSLLSSRRLNLTLRKAS